MDNKAALEHSKKPTALIRRLPPRNAYKVGLRLAEGIEIVRIEDIICCEAWSNYCRIHLNGRSEPILMSKPLKSVLSSLPEAGLYRVHQSYAIRIEAISSVGDQVILNNGMSVPLSRRNKPGFMSWLNQNITLI
jgi:DNA-binding LytR/AlgR family response regulator